MTVETLFAFLVAVAIIVVVPGPNILIVVNDSITHGFKKSLATILGIKVGTFLLVLLSMAGIATLLNMFSTFYYIIK